MTQIRDFDAQDIDILAALFVQAAIHVSHAEDEDGEDDDVLEMKALAAGLREISGRESKAEIVRALAKEALARKGEWDKWGQGVFKIEPICTKAMGVFKTKASQDEARQYAAAVMEVATAVAQAYGEFGVPEDEPENALGAFMKKVFSGFKSDNEAHHPMNVTPAEESALLVISKALKNA